MTRGHPQLWMIDSPWLILGAARVDFVEMDLNVCLYMFVPAYSYNCTDSHFLFMTIGFIMLLLPYLLSHTCIYIYIYLYIFIYHVYMCMYFFALTQIWKEMYIYIYIWMKLHIYIFTYIYIHVYLRIFQHTHIHLYTYLYIYIIHVCVHAVQL